MRDSKKKLGQQVEQLQELVPCREITNRDISGATVGWHISHCLKVCTEVFDALAASNPAAFKKEFSLPRFLVLLTGHIPRGKARAPKKVLPEGEANNDHLQAQVLEVREKLKNFDELPSNSYFEHPYFKKVSKDQTPRFLVVHTKHHLKIIRDILKKS